MSAFDTLFITRTRHDLKMGGQFSWGSDGVDGHFGENGQFTFTSDAFFDANNPATWPFSFSQRLPGVTSYTENYIASFVQDTWTIHPRVRLNLGLRYDLNTDSRNNAFYMDFLNLPQNAGLDRFVSKGNRGTDTNNIQPRTGVVWDVRGDGTLVGRSGWGRYITRDKPWIQVSNENGLTGNLVTILDPNLLKLFPDVNAVLGGRPLSQFGAAAGRQANLIGDTFEMPQMTTTTVGVGWELTSTTSLDADYVHAYGNKQQGSTDRNLPPTGAVSASNPRPVPPRGDACRWSRTTARPGTTRWRCRCGSACAAATACRRPRPSRVRCWTAWAPRPASGARSARRRKRAITSATRATT